MSDDVLTRPIVRDLTEAEVQSFRDNGWVLVRNYIDMDRVNLAMERARELMGLPEDGKLPTKAGKMIIPQPGETPEETASRASWWQNLTNVSDTEELFAEISKSEAMGRNVERLWRRSAPVQYWADALGVKLPVSWGGSDGPTPWHQDLPYFPIDRSGLVTCWIALNDLTPDMGTMRFMNGSNKGELCGAITEWTTQYRIFEKYPHIRQEHEECEPVSYGAGDATFHHGHTIHGAPANTSDRGRWNYAATYFAGDSLYTGQDCGMTDDLGFEVNKPLTHPRFPTVWKGSF